MSDTRCRCDPDVPRAKPEDYDRIFGVLADARCRRVLHYLVEESACETKEVVEAVVDWETGSSENSPKSIASSLRHVHLPKLKEARMIDYDDRSGSIRYEGDSLLEHHLRCARTTDLP
jgi:DNA-binding transcriptional ArsR family regulator